MGIHRKCRCPSVTKKISQFIHFSNLPKSGLCYKVGLLLLRHKQGMKETVNGFHMQNQNCPQRRFSSCPMGLSNAQTDGTSHAQYIKYISHTCGIQITVTFLLNQSNVRLEFSCQIRYPNISVKLTLFN